MPLRDDHVSEQQLHDNGRGTGADASIWRSISATLPIVLNVSAATFSYNVLPCCIAAVISTNKRRTSPTDLLQTALPERVFCVCRCPHWRGTSLT